MEPPGADRRRRPVPMLLLYIGIPAYLVVAGFSVWDTVDSHSGPVAVLAVLGIVAFTAVFLWLAIASTPETTLRQRVLAIATMAVLAVALALLGTTTAVYLVATAAMAGDVLPTRFALPVILAATGAVFLYSLGSESSLENVLTETVVPLVVGLFSYGVGRLAATNDELRAAREELATLAVANERLRFARDLHDLLGHGLTVIRAKSELAARLVDVDPDRAAAEMEDVERLARQSLGEVREAVAGYRHSTLAAELANGEAALRAAGIEPDVHADGVEVADGVDETLGWVVREAITNVVRHSRAARCRVETVRDGGQIRLEVADDGPGDPTPGTEATNGSGLVGIRERLAAVGGTLEVGSSPGGGFRLVARVPATAPATA